MDDRGLSVGSSDDGTFVPFTDILFNALLGLALMVFIAFSLINPEAKTRDRRSSRRSSSSPCNWPDNTRTTSTPMSRIPSGELVWYHSREAGLMVLDRDDRGNYRDTLTVNGQTFQNALNQETVTIRKHHSRRIRRQHLPLHRQLDRQGPRPRESRESKSAAASHFLRHLEP